MNSIFNATHLESIINRIDRLNSQMLPLWGQMNVGQMLAHCSAFQAIPMGNTKARKPKGWLKIVIGRLVKPLFYNEKPMAKNIKTLRSLQIVDEKDFEAEKEKLKNLLINFQQTGESKCANYPHPFFGKLTTEQWGKGVYKHLDHHLKQFGV